jgi:hypothetical protein
MGSERVGLCSSGGPLDHLRFELGSSYLNRFGPQIDMWARISLGRRYSRAPHSWRYTMSYTKPFLIGHVDALAKPITVV